MWWNLQSLGFKLFWRLLLQGAKAKYGIGRIGFKPLFQDAEGKYGIIFKTFFSLISLVFDKNAINLRLPQLFKNFFKIEIQPNISEQDRKRQRIYDFLNAETKLQSFSEIIGIPLWPSSNPDLNPLDYAIWGVLENKTNATSHPNIGSPKTAIEEEWNKMSEEFILKACKSFQRCVDTIIEKKNSGHIE